MLHAYTRRHPPVLARRHDLRTVFKNGSGGSHTTDQAHIATQRSRKLIKKRWLTCGALIAYNLHRKNFERHPDGSRRRLEPCVRDPGWLRRPLRLHCAVLESGHTAILELGRRQINRNDCDQDSSAADDHSKKSNAELENPVPCGGRSTSLKHCLVTLAGNWGTCGPNP